MNDVWDEPTVVDPDAGRRAREDWQWECRIAQMRAVTELHELQQYWRARASNYSDEFDEPPTKGE